MEFFQYLAYSKEDVATLLSILRYCNINMFDSKKPRFMYETQWFAEEPIKFWEDFLWGKWADHREILTYFRLNLDQNLKE